MAAKFSIGDLLSFTFALVVLCVLVKWVVDPSEALSLAGVDVLFVPTMPMMGVGIGLIPLFCMPMTLVAMVLVLRTERRPFSSLVFFCVQFVVIFIDVATLDIGLRFWVSMMVGAVAMVVEAWARELALAHWVAGGIAITVSIAWYIASVCVVVSASI